MKITTRITWKISTWEVIEHEYFAYTGPVALCGPSDAEKQAQAQAAAESAQLQKDFQTQFSEQQGLLNNFIIPQLQSMISNPTGFGPTAIADMNANLVNTVGAQAVNAKQQAQASFDTANEAGLPSGVEQAIKAQISSGAGGEIAQGTTNIQLANEQAKLAQQSEGRSLLMGAEGALGAAPQTGSLELGANQNSFNQAYNMQQQGSWWQNILSGVVGAGAQLGLGALTGGFSGGGSNPFSGTAAATPGAVLVP